VIYDNGFFSGQLLIAMPGMEDNRFHRAVIYICSHSQDGAMGIVLNQPQNIGVPDLLQQLGIVDKAHIPYLPSRLRMQAVRNGGPVEQARGFVLHSDDYSCSGTVAIADDIALTSTVEVLHDLSRDKGPAYSVVALGYAGWGAGQLEAEIAANSWLTTFATPELLFDGSADSQYERCLAGIGVDLMRLVRHAGHA